MGQELETVRIGSSPLAKANCFVGSIAVKNWDPLLKIHEQTLESPVFEIKYEVTCCGCKKKSIVSRLGMCSCRHTCCDKCKVVEWKPPAVIEAVQESKQLTQGESNESRHNEESTDTHSELSADRKIG